MVINELTIIISAVLILLAIVSSLANPFFRWKTRSVEEEEESSPSPTLPPVTILIAPHDNAHELEAHLPLLLSQVYEPGYEVIVVAEKGDAETEDVLKRFDQNPHLYSTFIPDSSRYMSRKKLAITLGVKAARNEWILLTDAFCAPCSDEWLRLMARHCTTERNLVIGYSGYAAGSDPFYRFERLHTACYLMNKDVKSVAYRTNGTNLMFRKSEFLNHNGYQGNLNLIRGEYDFLVNKYARKGGTALELSPEAWIREDAPSVKSWRNKHIFYLETRRHLKRSRAMRALFNFDQAMMHLNFLTIITAAVWSILTQNWIVTAASLISLIITVVLRIRFASRMICRFNEKISLWAVIPYEMSLVWHNLVHLFRYKSADKYDFTSHKL